MNALDESLASIEKLLEELKLQETELDQIIEKKVNELLTDSDKKLEDRKKEELDQFKAEIAEKYRKKIENRIKKLENSKVDLLFLKTNYGYLIGS